MQAFRAVCHFNSLINSSCCRCFFFLLHIYFNVPFRFKYQESETILQNCNIWAFSSRVIWVVYSGISNGNMMYRVRKWQMLMEYSAWMPNFKWLHCPVTSFNSSFEWILGIFSGIHWCVDYFGHVIVRHNSKTETHQQQQQRRSAIASLRSKQWQQIIYMKHTKLHSITNWIWINSIWRMGQVMHNTWNATNQLWCQFGEYLFVSYHSLRTSDTYSRSSAFDSFVIVVELIFWIFFAILLVVTVISLHIFFLSHQTTILESMIYLKLNPFDHLHSLT